MNPNQTCSSCHYFRLHYIKTDERYEPLCRGHCTHPLLKGRMSNTPACKHFHVPSKQKLKFPPE